MRDVCGATCGEVGIDWCGHRQRGLEAMNMPSRTRVIIVGLLVSLALALYFGLTASGYTKHPHGDYGGFYLVGFTDWGRVALTLIFGSLGLSGLLFLLRKP